MVTFIVFSLAALCVFVMLGAAITFVWLCAVAAGQVVGWVMGVQAPEHDPESLTPQELAEIDALIRRSRKAVGLPPIR